MIEAEESAKVTDAFKVYVKYRSSIKNFTIEEIQSALIGCDSQTDKQKYPVSAV